jgi:hypothetical protein
MLIYVPVRCRRHGAAPEPPGELTAGRVRPDLLEGRERTHLVALVRAGARFERGYLVERPEALAA